MKKGQFYLIAAALLIALSFSAIMLSKKNFSQSDVDSFVDLRGNYLSESAEVINNILYIKNRDNANFNFARFDNFTRNFLGYSQTIDSRFSLAYALAYHNSTEFRNYLGKEVLFNGTEIIADKEKKVFDSGNFFITVNNFNYSFEVDKDVELNVLFLSEANNMTRVFRYDG